MRDWRRGVAAGETEAVDGNNWRLSEARCDIHRGLIVLRDAAGGFKATHLGSASALVH